MRALLTNAANDGWCRHWITGPEAITLSMACNDRDDDFF
jgi:hypothetical protein